MMIHTAAIDVLTAVIGHATQGNVETRIVQDPTSAIFPNFSETQMESEPA